MTSELGTAFQPSLLLPDPPQLAEFNTILRSNTLPADMSRFRRVIHETPAELVRYDTEIKRLQTVLNGLVSDRAMLTDYADGCQSLFTPIRRLPPELLVEIFEACAPPNAVDFCPPETAEEEFNRLTAAHVLRLSQVCSYWRSVAMRTARLWSWIVTDTTLWPDSHLSNESYIEQLRSSLEHGGSYPLTLRVIVKHEHPDEGAIMETLAKHSVRWRDVYLCCRLESLALLASIGDLPLLERACICNHAPAGNATVNTTFLEGAPRLRDVMFHGPISNLPSIPWAQLQYFRYRNDDGDVPDLFGSLSLLRHLSADTNFSLFLDIAAADLSDFPPIVSHVSALGLGLMGTDADQATQALKTALNALTLPHLKDLIFERDWYKPTPRWVPAEFSAFAARSALHANLTTLDIHIAVSDADLLQCLPLVPLLTHMGISDCSGRAPNRNILITDTLLRRLAWRSDESCLIPRLHFLFLSSLFTFTDAAFLDFLTSRLAPGRARVVYEHDRALVDERGRPEPFQSRVWWLAGRERGFSPETEAQITELMERGELGFKSLQDPDEPFDDPYYHGKTTDE